MPLDTIMRVAKSTMEAFLKGPPKLYNPQYMTNANWIKLFSEDMRKHGLGYAYNNSRMQSTRRKGTYVGSDYNGNKYYEDRSAPYNRSRWVEYPVVQGVWAIEMRYDGSMVSPEWHGWLHYMHDKTGNELAAEFEKPFKQALPINQSMLRPEYAHFGVDSTGRELGNQPPEFHQPPGAHNARVVRGRVGAKYQAWGAEPSKQRNFADNSKTLHIP